MILVTGASGKTGRATIQALAAKNVETRAMVRREAQAAELITLDATETVVADLTNPADLDRAFAGIAQIYLICPNMHPNETGIAKGVIAAAKIARVQRIVYHSVLHPQTEKMPHHWNKLRVEEILFESGIAHTILQPAAYMQNVLAAWPAIVDEGIYRVPYAPTTRLGMVDLNDVAEAAANVLLDERLTCAIYELCGPQILDQNQIAEKIGQHVGRPVVAASIEHEAWSRNAKNAGIAAQQIEWLLKMFNYYERYGFYANPSALTQLLGRSPNSFEAFLEQNS